MIPSIEELPGLLEELGYEPSRAWEIAAQVRHFEEEAPARDSIVEQYFDRSCVERIVQAVAEQLLRLGRPSLRILDIGAGSGYFTSRILSLLREAGIRVEAYGLDVTPGMLRRLAEKGITPVWGTAERVAESIELARTKLGLRAPERFDAVITTFTLHHIPEPSEAMAGIAGVLESWGVTVVVDISKYSDAGLQEELSDVHPGFEPRELEEAATKAFGEVAVGYLEGVRCRAGRVETGVVIGVLANPRPPRRYPRGSG